MVGLWRENQRQVRVGLLLAPALDAMSPTTNALLTAGASFAAKKLTPTLANLDVNDALRLWRGFRRQSNWTQTFITLGVGALVGGATAILVTPFSGKEARSRLVARVTQVERKVFGDFDVNISNDAADEHMG